MSEKGHGWTTASIEAVPRVKLDNDPTPGLVLIYSRMHAQLPAALPFAADLTTIGREADNTLSIPEAAVSRFHAKVERRRDGDWVIDMGSTNGLVVNGLRVDQHRLRAHDIVRIGDTIFRYAQSGIYAFSAYRVDGSVVETARPVDHAVRDSPIIGGYQTDALLGRMEKVARTQLSVVVTGESGTGKELVAREVHRLSERPGPFQAINCAALPANLLESELFGYKKGAFTGASTDKLGLVRAADGGTLFLDEIGDMPLEAQAKLLRVLQEKEVLPLGSTVAVRVDVRVVCATHRNLDEYVAEGKFRGDLLARLREFAVALPALRQRREDLYCLVRHFMKRAGHSQTRVSFPFMLALAHYRWPYNVRELESAVKLSIALAESDELDLAHLPAHIQQSLDGHGDRPAVFTDATGPGTMPQPAPSAAAKSGTPSEARLRQLLSEHRGNIAAVGRELGKERMQIHRWLKRYNIDINTYRD